MLYLRIPTDPIRGSFRPRGLPADMQIRASVLICLENSMNNKAPPLFNYKPHLPYQMAKQSTSAATAVATTRRGTSSQYTTQ